MTQLKRRAFCISLFAIAVSSAFGASPSYAANVPQAVSLGGELFLPDGTPVTSGNVNFQIQVFDAAETCVLYSENQLGVNLKASNGRFNLILGTGSGVVNNISGSAMLDDRVFANPGVVTVANCSQPTVALNAGSQRQIRISYDIGAGLVALSPDVPLVSSAYAMVADTVQGKGAADFLQVVDNGTTVLNQANAAYTFSSINWPRLKALLDGTSNQYLPTTPSAPLDFNNQRVTNVQDPTGAQDAATKHYADSMVAGYAVDTTAVGPMTGNNNVLLWDATANKWVAGAVNSSPTGAAGGDLTGTYPNPTIKNDAVTAAKIASTGGGPNRLLITDPTTGATIGYGVCALNEVYAWTATGWACTSVASLSPVTSVAGRTGAITLGAGDIGGLGTAALYDWGTAANQIPRLDGSGRMPAVDGSQLTNVNATQLQTRPVGTATPLAGQVLGFNGTAWVPVSAATGSVTNIATGNGLSGGPITSTGTLSVDAGTSANKIVQLDPSAKLPAVDGSNLYNVKLGTRSVATNAPGAGQVLGFNVTTTQWEPVSASTGSVTNVTGGVGLNGGSISSTGTLSVDVGTTANKIMQLDPSAKIPAVDASQLYNVNASKIATRTVSSATPVAGQVLGFNTSTTQWEPTTASTGSVQSVNSGVGLTGGPITSNGTLNVDVGTTANKILQLDPSAKIPAVDGSLLYNVKLGTRSVATTNPSANQVLGWNASTTQWEPQAGNANSITTIATGNGVLGGPITSTGTISIDVGTTANKIMQLDPSAKIPAVDASQLYNVNASKIATRTVSSATPAAGQVLGFNVTTTQWEPVSAATGSVQSVNSGVGLTGGPITSNGTLNVDVGTTANKIMQLDPSAKIPAVDASQLYNVNASKIATRTVSSATPLANQVLGFNVTTTQWEPQSGNANSVTNVSTGNGLSGGPITSTGTLSVDAGTTANKILQLNSSALIPAVDGSLLYNINATKLATRAVSSATPVAGQVLGFNVSTTQWEPTTASTGSVTTITASTGLLGGVITSTGTVSVDIGSAAGKIVQENANAQIAQMAGTTALPSYSFAGNTATGMYSSAANTLNLATSGTTAVTILPNGNVGIGTSNPTSTLVVGGSAQTGALTVVGSTSALATIKGAGDSYSYSTLQMANSTDTKSWLLTYRNGVSQPADGQSLTWQYFDGSTYGNRMTLTASGAMGLGTNLPAAGLDLALTGTVNSAIIIPRDSTANRPTTPVNGMLRYNNSLNAMEGYINNAWATLSSTGAGTSAGTVTNILASTGLLGGTITSTGTLSVDVGSAASKIVQENANAQIAQMAGTTALPSYSFAGNTATGMYSSAANTLNFATSGTTAMTVLPNGAVGIGITSPSYALHVTDTSNNPTLEIGPSSSATSSNATLYLSGRSGGTQSIAKIYADYTSNLIYQPATNQSHVFNTGTGALAMTILGNGNVGLGSATPAAILDIGSTGTAGSAIIVPRDSTANRPSNAVNGMLRYNNTLNAMEGYINGAWATLSSTGAGTSAGTVTNILASTGLLGGTITSTGTISVDVGSAATKIVQENANAQIAQMAGTVALPSYSFAGSLNTGLYSPASNSVTLATNGSAALTAAASGWIGIGSTSPTAPLNVASTTTLTAGTYDGTLSATTVQPGAASSATFNGFHASVSENANNTANGPIRGVFAEMNSNGPNYTSEFTGVYSNVQQNHSAGSVGSLRGTANDVANMNGATTYAYGTYNYTRNANAGSIGDAIGTYDWVRNVSSGTITNAYGSQTRIENNGLGTIGSAYGFFTATPINPSGTITNYYGLYVQNPGTTATNSYSIYSEGGRNFFGGNVGIGTNAPLAALDITATGTAASAIIVPRDSTANRPSAPVNGMLRYNNTLNAMEGYINGAWSTLASTGAGTSAGTLTYVGAGNGLTGGPITSTGTLAVDAGTAANKVVQLNPNSQIATAFGTVALPSHSFANSPAAGMYSPGTNQLAFATSGTAALNINSSGQIGIGTAASGARFTINGTSVAQPNAVTRITTTGGDTFNGPYSLVLGDDSQDSTSYRGMRFGITSSGQGFIDAYFSSINKDILIQPNGGRVGFGTNTPQAGVDFATTGTGGSAIILPRDTTANRPTVGVNGMLRYNSSLNTVEAYINSAWTALSTGTSSGSLTYVGAGNGLTGGPITSTGTLTVDTGTTANKIVQLNPNAQVATAAGTVALPAYSFVGNGATGLYSPGANQLALVTSGTAALNVTANGYVGIGTSNPTTTLGIVGTAPAADVSLGMRNLSSTGTTKYIFNNDATGYVGVEMYGSNHATTNLRNSAVYTSSNDMYYMTNSSVQNGGTGKITFMTGGWDMTTQIRAVIDATGKLGVGTTSPAAGLDIATTGTGGSAIILPRDSTANRPSSPVNGMLRYNNTLGAMEGYINSTWATLASTGAGTSAGTVTNILASTGLLGGTITSTGTISVDVGSAAGKIVQENANAQIAQMAGTAALPSYSFAGNTGTGMYSPGAGSLSLSSYGTAALTINAPNYVGIGTSNALYPLHVQSNGLSTSSAATDRTNYAFLSVNPSSTTQALGYASLGQTDYISAQNATGVSAQFAGVNGSARLMSAATVANLNGIYGLAQNNSTGTITRAAGVFGDTYANSGTITNGYGVYGWARDATGVMTNAFGVGGVGQHDTSGTMAIATGGQFSVTNAGTGTITNSYGVSIGAPTNTGGGSIGAYYGLYIQQPTVATTNFALYSVGGTNYFGGNVGIGSLTPQAALDINATGTANSAIILPRDSTTNRPSNPVNGMLRYNNTLGAMEGYINSAWSVLATGTAASASLSSLGAATTTNNIDNLLNAQTWNWSTATIQSPMTMTANGLTTGSLLTLTSSNTLFNSMNGLLNVANTGSSTNGTVARLQANSGANTGFTLKANGQIGIGTATPNYPLDLRATGTSQLHISLSGDDGLYITAPTTTSGVISNGATFNGSSWTAKSAVSSALALDSFGVHFYSNSGLTIGNTTTPTQVMQITPNGNLAIGASAAAGAGLDVQTTGTGGSAIIVPRDSTANRPSNAVNGMIRYNNTLNAMEGYVNGAWSTFATGTSSSATLSSLGAATTTNTIDNLLNAQTWNWSTATTQTAMSESANALTSGGLLSLSSSSSSLNSTNGLLNVANTGTSTSGVVARMQANSTTAGSGLYVLANGNVGIGTSGPDHPLSVMETNNGGISIRGVAGQNSGNSDLNLITATNNGNWALAANSTAGNFVVYDNLNGRTPVTLEPNAPTNSLYVKASGTIGVGTSAPGSGTALSVEGQIRTKSGSITTGSVDWSLGNAITTTFDCGSNISFANLRDGASYTLVVTGTGTTMCPFSTTTTGDDAGTVSYRFNPANSTRTASSHTIYSLMRIGNVVYISWITGF